MKCDKCGHFNVTGKKYCAKCGCLLTTNSYNNNAVKEYKQTAKDKASNLKTFNRTEKFIIAIAIIGILMLVTSAVIPSDTNFSNLWASNNDTPDETPIIMKNDTIEKIDTYIRLSSVAANDQNVIVDVYVTDVNGYAVNEGTASITINDVKYSGQVENGNAIIYLPKLSENSYTVTLVYEGTQQFNPSQMTTTIEIQKQNTFIDTQVNNNTILATLKTDNNETVRDATINIILPDNTQIKQQTDSNGNIQFNVELTSGKNIIKMQYEGNENYNPCEKTVEIGLNKTDTKIDANYDEQNKLITVKLTDSNNNPINDTPLSVIKNSHEKRELTNHEGIVEIPVEEGLNKIDIKFDGDDNSNPSNTTINTVIDKNDTSNDTENSIQTDNHNNTTGNVNQSILEEDVTYPENTTNSTEENVKVNTTIKTEIDEENETIILELLDQDKNAISNESIEITLDNGTLLTQITDDDGKIILDLDEFEDINKLELLYDGDEKYNSTNETLSLDLLPIHKSH